MASEKIEITPSPATEGDINRFLLGEGGEFQEGGRYSSTPTGYGSGPEYDRQVYDEGIQEQPPRTEEALYAPQGAQEGQDFRQLYGRSENEKGQWRRVAEDAMTQLEQLKGELALLRNATSTTANYPPSQQGYNVVSTPTQQQQPVDYSQMLPATYFPNKQPNDVVEVAEVDQLVRGAIGPAVLQLQQQQQALWAQQIAAMKASAGITPAVEARLVSTHPWLNNVQDGQPRIAAMQSIIVQASQPAQPTQAAPQPLVNPTQAAARRVTYVESGRPTSPDGAGKPLQQIIAEEFAQAKTSAEKRAVLMKYGAQRANEFGSSVLTR